VPLTLSDPIPVDLPVDWSLGDARVDDPFAQRVVASAKGPDGRALVVPGFYQAGAGFIVRMSFPAAGRWTVVTSSAASPLDGLRVVVDVVEAGAGRPALAVDPVRPHHFLRGDEHFLFLGYEIDWLLQVDQDDASLERVRAVVDSIAAAGFTVLTVNLYAHSFRRHVPADLEADGRWILPTRAPWPGGNEEPDWTSFDPVFFAHVDAVMDLIQERGLVIHLMVHVYNKDVNWPDLGSELDDRFWRYVVARYQAYTCIVWDTAKESYFVSAPYVWSRIAIIRADDGYRRLLTVHDAAVGEKTNQRRYLIPVVSADRALTDGLTDFVSDQITSGWYEDALEHRLGGSKPYVNIEYGYESGIDDLPSDATDHDQSWQEVARRMWLIALGGGYSNYYYRNTAWSLFIPFPEPPGYAAVRVFADFWAGTSYWRLAPAADVVTTARGTALALAETGRECVVFLERGDALVVTPGVLGDAARVRWLDPLTGETTDEVDVDLASRTIRNPFDGAVFAVAHILSSTSLPIERTQR
jgi:hypothetical protein